MTTFLIVLLLFVTALTVGLSKSLVKAKNEADRLLLTNNSLNAKLIKCEASEKETRADYYIARINVTDNLPLHLNGKWAVWRKCSYGNFCHRTCIKVFTDPDEDYCRREAESLIEKINEQ